MSYHPYGFSSQALPPRNLHQIIAQLHLGPIAPYTLQSFDNTWSRAGDYHPDANGCQVAPSQVASGQLGLFTSNPFGSHERIHAESALLILPADAQLAAISASQIGSLLPRADQLRLRDLAGAEDGWAGIVLRNAFGITVDGLDALGLFPALSRLNHSCTPNVDRHYDESTGQLSISAVSFIPSHTELTVAYCDPLLPRHERQHRLYTLHNFTCHCEACSLPDEDVELSDARRAFIASRLPGAPEGELEMDDLRYLSHAMRAESYLFGLEEIERQLERLDPLPLSQPPRSTFPSSSATTSYAYEESSTFGSSSYATSNYHLDPCAAPMGNQYWPATPTATSVSPPGFRTLSPPMGYGSGSSYGGYGGGSTSW